MVRIERTTALEVMGDPQFPALRDEYMAECDRLGLQDPREKMELYRMLDDSGSFHALAAFEDEDLVGFAAVLAPVLPHYGRTVATMESLFVASARRRSGAGLLIIHEAERLASELGAPAILVSAPACGRLESILPALGYRHTNTVYMRGLCHE